MALCIVVYVLNIPSKMPKFLLGTGGSPIDSSCIFQAILCFSQG